MEYIVNQRIQDIYYDLKASTDDGRIHETDLRSYLYDDLLPFYGSREEYVKHEEDILVEIRKMLGTDKDGWVRL